MPSRVQNADFNGYRLTNLGDPVNPQDGVSLAYMNSHLPVVPPAYVSEVGYNEVTSPVTVTTAATEASPLLLVQSGLFTFDGNPVIAHFFCGRLVLNSTAGCNIGVGIWENTGTAVQLNRWGGWYNPIASPLQVTVKLEMRMAPSAGQHKYFVGTYCVTDGGVFTCAPFGSGSGVNAYAPMFLRFAKA